MAQEQRRSIGGRLAACLTAVFMSVASVGGQAQAQEVCTQNLTQSTVRPQTGYRDLDDLRLASAYARAMQLQQLDPTVLHALMEASEQAGVDFELMLVKAILESNLGEYDAPLHVAGAARGIYQFLPATWLTLFSWFGGDYNNGQYRALAEAIHFDDGDEPYVLDDKVREQILALRSDHYVAAFIKAKQIRFDERPVLRSMLGREPSITDYYIVHFLGIPRARTFYSYLESQPGRSAAEIMQREAYYNEFVFYRNGKPRSFAQVYERLDRIIGNRLEDIRAAAKGVLENEKCTPALRRDAPPASIHPGFSV